MTKPECIIDKQITKEQLEKLKGKSLLVGTPMYGGMCCSTYVYSMLELMRLCTKIGLPLNTYYIMNESLVQRARNQIANSFLETQHTHLIFIDADIGFNPVDVLSLLLADKSIIGGAYPKKSLNFTAGLNAKKKGVPDNQLGHCMGNFVYRPLCNTEIKVFEMKESKYLGTGFMMITKDVLERMKPFVPNYKPNSGMPGEEKKRFWAYFSCEVINDEYLSEDYWFCEIAGQHGEIMWLAPWVYLTHMGTMEFKGCFFCSQGSLIHEIGQPKQNQQPTPTAEELLARLEASKK
jgi:hypothetical protein